MKNKRTNNNKNMNKNILAALLALAEIAFSCTSYEETLPSQSQVAEDGAVVYNPTATIEPFVLVDEAATKTVLSIDDATGATFTFEATDRLGVYPYSPEKNGQISFSVKASDATSCTFAGEGYGLNYDQYYAAYYPLCQAGYGDLKQGITSADMMTQLPVDYTKQRQSSTDGTTFNISSADVLVSNGITPSEGVCHFTMSHIGALVVMDVTFPEGGTFTELVLSSETTPFVAKGTIDLTQSVAAATGPAAFVIDPVSTSNSVSLELADETGAGLAIEAGQTVRFCMMVAPVNLKDPASALTLSVIDVDKVVYSADVKSKNFKAGYAYKIACTLEAAIPSEPTNLSADATANTYIVDVDNVNPAGYYFTTTVAGNGASMQADIIGYFGANGANLWPQNGNPALIGAATVSVLWNQNNCISDVAYNAADRTISFKATGAKGNAKVCAQINGINFWTWLIWCTDQPGTIEFTNEHNGYTFTVMDRNIGATTNAGSTDLQEMDGVYYQWGNPIPYNTSEWAASSYTNSNNTMMNSLWYPETVHVPVQWAVQWFAPDGNFPKQLYGLLWGGGSTGAEQAGLDQKYHIRHGNTSTKTMYDPCPPGYKVLPYDVLEGYAKVGASSNTSANVYGIVLAGDNGGEVLIPYNGMAWVGGNGIMSWAQAGVYDPELDNACYLYLWTASYNNTKRSLCHLCLCK